MLTVLLSWLRNPCHEIHGIAAQHKDIKQLQKDNDALRDAYGVNYTAALTEYQRLREALYRYMYDIHVDGQCTCTGYM